MATKRCYILGAGFGKACDFPLAKDLTGAVFSHTYPKDFWHPQMAQEKRDLLRRLYPRLDINSGQWPDFEDLITVLGEWNDFRLAYDGKADADICDMKGVLIRDLGSFLCDNTKAARSHDNFKAVLEFVKRASAEDSPIISFNWDLLLEVAGNTLGLTVVYRPATKGEVALLKPHGSVNLAEMPKVEFVELSKVPNVHSLDIESEQGDTVVVRTLNPHDASDKIAPFKARLLVEPAARKDYRSTWIVLQWRWALNAVLQAEEIVVIGYSFPATDTRTLLLLRLAAWHREKEVSLIVVDPKANRVKTRLGRCLGTSIVTIEKSWQDALSDF